jgi:predicted Zn-ribbon and HTH transcriptional regulator
MPIDVACADCTWSEDDLSVTEVPLQCPECYGSVIRGSEPIDLSGKETKTDRV